MEEYRFLKWTERLTKGLAGAVIGFLFGVYFFSGIAFLCGIHVYYENSDSMEPVISKGSLVMVKEKKEYFQGDIVTFLTRYEGQPVCVTHRIVGKQDGSYQTKGDGNRYLDGGQISGEEITGKVVGTVPGLGSVCWLIHSAPWALAVLFLGIFSLLLL